MHILSRPVIGAFISSIFAALSLSVFMNYVGNFLSDLSATALIISIIFFSRNFIQIFIRVPIAEFSQIIGRKPLIIGGIFFLSIALIIMYFATSWHQILIATLFVAIGMSGYWPGLFAYIGDISTDDYGKINAFVFQGSDIGVLLGALITKYLLSSSNLMLRDVFFQIGLISLIGSIFSYVILPESLSDENRLIVNSKLSSIKTSFVKSFESLIRISKKKHLNLIYLYQFIISFIEYFVGSFFPLLIVISLGFSYSQLAEIVFYSIFILFIVKLFAGKITDRFYFKNIILISFFTSSILLFSLTIVKDFVLIIIIYSVFLSISMVAYLAINGGTSKYSQSKERGLAVGALGFYVSFGRTTTSLLLAPLWEYYELIFGRSYSLILIFRSISTLIFIISLIFIYRNKFHK